MTSTTGLQQTRPCDVPPHCSVWTHIQTRTTHGCNVSGCILGCSQLSCTPHALHTCPIHMGPTAFRTHCSHSLTDVFSTYVPHGPKFKLHTLLALTRGTLFDMFSIGVQLHSVHSVHTQVREMIKRMFHMGPNCIPRTLLALSRGTLFSTHFPDRPNCIPHTLLALTRGTLCSIH